MSLPMDQHDKSTTGGGKTPVRWEVVATAPGLAPAQIIAGRLRAEGIPARAWQESAGRATGLVVGLLGLGYVEVPEEYVEQALDILGTAVADLDPADDNLLDEDLEPEPFDEWNDDNVREE